MAGQCHGVADASKGSVLVQMDLGYLKAESIQYKRLDEGLDSTNSTLTSLVQVEVAKNFELGEKIALAIVSQVKYTRRMEIDIQRTCCSSFFACHVRARLPLSRSRASRLYLQAREV